LPCRSAGTWWWQDRHQPIAFTLPPEIIAGVDAAAAEEKQLRANMIEIFRGMSGSDKFAHFITGGLTLPLPNTGRIKQHKFTLKGRGRALP
jgi:hypothetical protein